MHTLREAERPYRATLAEFYAFLIAFIDLFVARRKAIFQELDPRAAPVRASQLWEAGVPTRILIWLMYHGFAEHFRVGCEGPDRGSDPRPLSSLTFTEASGFVLTDKGLVFADQFLADALLPLWEGDRENAWDCLILGHFLPRYDRENRLFLWGQHVLKCFRQCSENQELILRSAEELGWPDWLDDPLLLRKGKNPKVRLHDTIKDLNRRQEPYLVHFKGDGTGRRIGWEYR